MVFLSLTEQRAKYLSTGRKTDFERIQMAVIFYEDEDVVTVREPRFETKFSVVDAGTLEAASRFPNPVCLSFASASSPGGGYKSVMDLPMPIKTQEEDLFRRSNLPELMDNEWVRPLYPLEGVEGLLCTDVSVTKGSRLEPIEPFYIGVVSVPAVVNPGREQSELVARKVLRILEIASSGTNKDLILGAWGCGVFNNNPKYVAELFYAYLKGSFAGIFDHVVFAVPGVLSENYGVFKAVIENRSL
jgi:hypothetical protein